MNQEWKFSALTMLKSHKCWMIRLIFLRTQELMVFQFLTSTKYHHAKMLLNSADKVNTSCFLITLLGHFSFAFLDVFSGRHFFLKPLNPYSEDRVCFDRIPEVEAELNTFLERYKTKISPSSPYFVSQFVQVRKFILMYRHTLILHFLLYLGRGMDWKCNCQRWSNLYLHCQS